MTLPLKVAADLRHESDIGTSMKRFLRYPILIFAILAAGVWTSAAPVQNKSQEKLTTPVEEYQALLKEFNDAAHIFWQDTTDQERQIAVTRVDKATSRCLELVEKNPKDPIALDALTQVVTEEYWLNTHTS